MARLFIALPLALLLSVSPILYSFAEYVCCCDGAPGNSHLHLQEDTHHDHDHGTGPAPTGASHHSDDDGERRHGSHHEHGADQPSGIIVATSAHPGASAPNSCSCEQADVSTMQTVAASQLGKTSRKSTKMTSGHLVSAIKMAEDRLYLRTHAVDAVDVSSPVSHLFLLNRALLI